MPIVTGDPQLVMLQRKLKQLLRRLLQPALIDPQLNTKATVEANLDHVRWQGRGARGGADPPPHPQILRSFPCLASAARLHSAVRLSHASGPPSWSASRTSFTWIWRSSHSTCAARVWATWARPHASSAWRRERLPRSAGPDFGAP